MTYGLKIINPSGELVMSSDAKGLYCLGKGTLQGSVVQPSGNATGSHPGRTAGYSVYRFSGHPGPLIFGVELVLNKTVGIRSVSNPSSNTWDVTVYCGDTPDAHGFETQYGLDVWAFGLPQTAPASGYGLAIYDASGNIAWDLTQLPLFAKGYISGSSSPHTIPSLTKPVVLGGHFCNLQFDANQGGNTWWLQKFTGGLKRTSSTSVGRQQPIIQQWQYNDIEEQFGNDGDDYDTSAFILEGNLLP